MGSVALPDGMDVTHGICDTCDEVYGWSVAIDAQLDEEYRDTGGSGTPRPGNHPFWSRHADLYTPHIQPVLEIAYDDMTWTLCLRHLVQIVARLAEAEG